jgi:hypothetical protein
MVTTATRADAEADAAESSERLDGLDDAARRGLRRDRRLGQLLFILGLIPSIAFGVLIYRNQHLEDTGFRTHATVVDTHVGTFDSVTLSYWWRGHPHRSVVHVDDANFYCTPANSQFDTLGCTSEPTAIVDRGDAGHATLQNELNFSPPAQVYFVTCACCLLLYLWSFCMGLSVVVQARRRRRMLANHPWRLADFQVRGSRERARRRVGLYEISHGDRIWQSLRFVDTCPRRIKALFAEEAVEIAGDVDGPAVVRLPGSGTLLTAEVAPLGLTAVGAISGGAELGECSADADGSPDAGPTLLLSGSDGDFDILGPRGESMGEMTQRRHRHQIFDREGRLQFTIVRKARRGIASNAQGTEIVTLKGCGRRMTFEFPMGTDGIGRSWATSVAPVGASKAHWALRDLTGREIAYVTRLYARYLVEIPDGDGALCTPLVVQALLVALANPPPS